MTDKFAIKLYEGCMVDVDGDYARFNLANPLRHGPLLQLKQENHTFTADPHYNAECLHPHNWLTKCIVNGCSERVDPDPDGPGICRACIADLRAQETP